MAAKHLASPALRRPVAGVLPALGALLEEVEVFDHDCACVVRGSKSENLRDGAANPPVPGSGSKPTHDQRDRHRHPKGVATGVKHGHRQVSDVQINRNDGTTAQVLE